MNRRFCILCTNYTRKGILLNFYRNESLLVRSSAELDESVSNEIDNNLKPRRHPGVMHHAPVSLPDGIKKSISNLLSGETPKRQMLREAPPLERYLMARRVPLEKTEFFNKRLEMKNEVKNTLEIDIESLPPGEKDSWNKTIENKVDQLLKKKLYTWNQVDFNQYMSQLYLVTRSAAEYAVVYKILLEIFKRTNFVPNTVFDFGSGVGSVIWAANSIWGSSVKEYYCVDSSSHMNSLSEEILKGSGEAKLVKKIFYRQFLPASFDITSDLVVSSHTLLELPSLQTRLDTVINLWKRTRKYLVLIEFGSEGGFKVLNEARTNILDHIQKSSDSEKDVSYIFAPCPHQSACPRSEQKCYFEASYITFPQKPESLRKEFYSYIVFAKGERDKTENEWPRIVQPVLARSGHVICRLCCSSGDLKEVIVTRSKHGKNAYRCAKASRWGDLLPFKLKPYEKHTKPPKSEENQND